MVQAVFFGFEMDTKSSLQRTSWWADRWINFGSQLVATKRIEREPWSSSLFGNFCIGDFQQDIGWTFLNMICFQTGGSSSHESFSCKKWYSAWRFRNASFFVATSVESRLSWFRRRRRAFSEKPWTSKLSDLDTQKKRKRGGKLGVGGSDGFVMLCFFLL